MTLTERSAATFRMVSHDLYKDIHKAIRAELFAVTAQAGSSDPSDRTARAAIATRVQALFQLLTEHAEHEDTHVQPLIEAHLPHVAPLIAGEHEVIESRMVEIQALANAAVDAPAEEQRARVHALYLDLAMFTAAYVEHEEVEERTVMPALDAAVGTEGLLAVHEAIIGSIPPDSLAASLALMFPAMNVDDRTELLGGVRASAPPEVFAGNWALAASVLQDRDMQELAARLGIA
jgi:hemerythrin HHE cation binding domain-containing protein